MHFNNVLIITDNIIIADKILNHVNKVSIFGLNLKFAVSPFSNLQKFKDVLGDLVSTVDLKNDHQVSEITQDYNLVISAHCKQLFPYSLFSNVTCINIHPGYNPFNRGWYPQVFAILNKTIIGATIHIIDNEIDHGPIIDRVEVNQYPNDTSLDLYNRILYAEVELFERNFKNIIFNNFSTFLPEFEGKVYSKADFRNLCFIDGNENIKIFDFIDRLRALSHGSFKNAFIIDPATKKKIYLSINLFEEI